MTAKIVPLAPSQPAEGAMPIDWQNVIDQIEEVESCIATHTSEIANLALNFGLIEEIAEDIRVRIERKRRRKERLSKEECDLMALVEDWIRSTRGLVDIVEGDLNKHLAGLRIDYQAPLRDLRQLRKSLG